MCAPPRNADALIARSFCKYAESDGTPPLPIRLSPVTVKLPAPPLASFARKTPEPLPPAVLPLISAPERTQLPPAIASAPPFCAASFARITPPLSVMRPPRSISAAPPSRALPPVSVRFSAVSAPPACTVKIRCAALPPTALFASRTAASFALMVSGLLIMMSPKLSSPTPVTAAVSAVAWIVPRMMMPVCAAASLTAFFKRAHAYGSEPSISTVAERPCDTL